MRLAAESRSGCRNGNRLRESLPCKRVRQQRASNLARQDSSSLIRRLHRVCLPWRRAGPFDPRGVRRIRRHRNPCSGCHLSHERERSGPSGRPRCSGSAVAYVRPLLQSAQTIAGRPETPGAWPTHTPPSALPLLARSSSQRNDSGRGASTGSIPVGAFPANRQVLACQLGLRGLGINRLKPVKTGWGWHSLAPHWHPKRV